LRLSTNDAIPFVEPSQQDPTEMNRPDAIVDLFEADGVLLQRVGNEEQFLLEPERPTISRSRPRGRSRSRVKTSRGS
jgi:hypothetical protein